MSAFDNWATDDICNMWELCDDNEIAEEAFNAGLEAGKAERDRLEERLDDWQRETALAKAERDRLREALQKSLDTHTRATGGQMIKTPVVQELVERVDRLEKCLGTLISWSIVQLGVEGVDQLLVILSGEESDK